MRLWVAVPVAGIVLFPAVAEVMLRLPLWAVALVGENVTVALTVPPAGRVTGLPIKAYGNGLNATEKPVPMANERTWLSETKLVIERVRWACWFTVTFPKERLPVMERGLVTPVPLAAMVAVTWQVPAPVKATWPLSRSTVHTSVSSEA